MLFESRFKGNEESSVVKKRKPKRRSEGRPLKYPDPELDEIKSKKFQIKYNGKLSLIAKLILNSFQNKYLYYAMDDILYQFGLDSKEFESLRTILYSPVLSLQNNYSVNFFDIWVSEIYIDEASKTNKFLKQEPELFSQYTYITIKFFYKIKLPPQKPESVW